MNQIPGPGGDDILSGGGSNQFFYSGADGNDVINGFDAANDEIILVANLNDSGIDDFADLAGRISDSADGAVVDLGGESYIRLSGIAASDVLANLDGYFDFA